MERVCNTVIHMYVYTDVINKGQVYLTVLLNF